MKSIEEMGMGVEYVEGLQSMISVGSFIGKMCIRDSISTDEAVVLFSPIIYVGAVFFPLLTAILAASKPARKAASISPIAAQKYTGVMGTVKHIRSLAHGKPYRCLLYTSRCV